MTAPQRKATRKREHGFSEEVNLFVFSVVGIALMFVAIVLAWQGRFDNATYFLVMAFWCRWEALHP